MVRGAGYAAAGIFGSLYELTVGVGLHNALQMQAITRLSKEI